MFLAKVLKRAGVAHRPAARASLPIVPAGVRVYAIGDVHGRLDLLDLLIEKIVTDIAERPAAANHMVVLGDLIDRGPNSCGVIDRLKSFVSPGVCLHVLMGNHEEVLLRLLDGESSVLENWLRFGGIETLQSYGLNVEQIRSKSEEEKLEIIRDVIPVSHQSFLLSLQDTVRIGDYLFVHAGIRPSIALAFQTQTDLRWIRDPFLSDVGDHGFVVVHGHTISEDVIERPNRIGIDTGAYSTGRLTALAIEGRRRWYLATGGLTA